MCVCLCVRVCPRALDGWISKFASNHKRTSTHIHIYTCMYICVAQAYVCTLPALFRTFCNHSTVRIEYKVGGYSIIPDIVINFSNSFSFAITKYTQLSRIVIYRL